MPMERIRYRGYYIDKTRNGYRVSKQTDSSVHAHLHNKNPCFILVDNVIGKRIPTKCGLYYLQSHIRLAEDEDYKRRLQDNYDVKLHKGKRQMYYNPHKKVF